MIIPAHCAIEESLVVTVANVSAAYGYQSGIEGAVTPAALNGKAVNLAFNTAGFDWMFEVQDGSLVQSSIRQFRIEQTPGGAIRVLQTAAASNFNHPVAGSSRWTFGVGGSPIWSPSSVGACRVWIGR
jgi:hypothetical protein